LRIDNVTTVPRAFRGNVLRVIDARRKFAAEWRDDN